MLYPTELRVLSGERMDGGSGGESQESVFGGKDDVFELDLHRRTCVHLEGDDAALGSFCGFVGDVDGELAVDVLLNVIPLGDDFVFVPVIFVDSGLNFLVITRFASDFEDGLCRFFALFDDDLLAAEGKNSTTFFLVKNTAVFVSVFEVGLVTSYDKFRSVDHLAAVLDAAVGVFFIVTRGHFEFEGEGEIGGFATFPCDESIMRDRIFWGGFRGDSSVDHGPEFWIAFPVGEVFAIEELGFSSECWDGEQCEQKDVFHDNFFVR